MKQDDSCDFFLKVVCQKQQVPVKCLFCWQMQLPWEFLQPVLLNSPKERMALSWPLGPPSLSPWAGTEAAATPSADLVVFLHCCPHLYLGCKRIINK